MQNCSARGNTIFAKTGFVILIAILAGVPLAIQPGLYFFDITPKLLVL